MSIARRHRLGREEAADVIQETWARLLAHAKDLRDAERIAGWVATTAARECIAVRRRAWREEVTPDSVVDGIQEWDVDDQLDARRRAAELRTAVASLPRRERLLLELLLEPDSPSYAEISRRLAMPIGSIGPVRQRALQRLRSLLAPDTFVPVASRTA